MYSCIRYKGYLVIFEVPGDEHWRNRNVIYIQIDENKKR